MTRYTTSQTVTAPSAGTYDIGCWGGGGGGANSLSGGGGGGGAFSYASVTVANGDQLVITIPAAAGLGAAGGTVTVVRNSVTLCSAFGGSGATGSSGGAGGTTGGVGSTKFAGGTGGGGAVYIDPEPPNTQYRARGGGGGSAGRGGAGTGGVSGTADFGDIIEGTGGSGNTSYAGTEFDGAGGGNAGVAGNGPGGGGGGSAAGAIGAVELIFTASDTTPPTINTNAAQSVQENSPLAVALTANESVTWSIRTSAQDAASVDYTHFEISGTTLRWTGNGTKNFEAPGDTGANNTYVVVIRAVDAANNTTDKTITVTVTDKADETAPTITHSANQSVDENQTLAISLTANESVTWSIVGGTDSADFEISGSTLRWAGNVTRDYESPADADTNNVYNVTVRATDGSSNTTDLAMTVTVNNVTVGEPTITGWIYPTGTPTQDASGTRAWTTLGNLVSDNATVATVTNMSAGQNSHLVTMSGFDLSSLPDNATIVGIEVQAEINGGSGSGTVTSTADFQLKGTGNTYSTPAGAINRDQVAPGDVFTVGGGTDVWGLSGANLTGSGFKSGFSMTMRATASASGSGSARHDTDYVRMRIYYTVGGPWGYAYIIM